jgi:hypothetical protein
MFSLNIILIKKDSRIKISYKKGIKHEKKVQTQEGLSGKINFVDCFLKQYEI